MPFFPSHFFQVDMIPSTIVCHSCGELLADKYLRILGFGAIDHRVQEILAPLGYCCRMRLLVAPIVASLPHRHDLDLGRSLASQTKISFPLGTKRTLLHAIRRTILRDLPYPALSNVNVLQLKSDTLDADYLRVVLPTLPCRQPMTFSCDMTIPVTDRLVHVTTRDCVFRSLEDPEIHLPDPFSHPVVLFSLKGGERIAVTAQTVLLSGSDSANHCPVTRCHLQENTGQLVMMPKSGRDPHEIMRQAIRIVQDRVGQWEGATEFKGDLHTLPGLLTSYLQDHPKVSYAGCAPRHLLEEIGTLHFSVKDSDRESVIKETVQQILKELDLLSKLCQRGSCN